MNRSYQKEPLYRKVNTKARNVHPDFGGDFKYSRHKKRETLEQSKGAMYGKKERGLDYTPLFKFLLSRVGSKWDEVFSEAKSRLDKTEPIFWLVALNENEKKDFVRVGASTYFSGVYVDNDGILQYSNRRFGVKDMIHYCTCCTHSFNGQEY